MRGVCFSYETGGRGLFLLRKTNSGGGGAYGGLVSFTKNKLWGEGFLLRKTNSRGVVSPTKKIWGEGFVSPTKNKLWGGVGKFVFPTKNKLWGEGFVSLTKNKL